MAGKLTEIASDKKGRSISAIEKSDFVPEAKYYSDLVTEDKRVEWHQNALNNFTDCNLVFLDPDNGLLVKSVGKKSSRSVKYVFYEEVKDYLDKGISVIVYNHRSRKKPAQYFGDIENKIYKYTDIPASAVQEITFPRMSVRDYFAIPANEKHFYMIKDAFSEMLDGVWGKTGMCTKSVAGDSFKNYIIKEDYIFLEKTSRMFHDNQSLEDYRKDIHRWLQLTYGYNSEYVFFLIDKDREYIKECYQKQESVESVAAEVGYLCG